MHVFAHNHDGVQSGVGLVSGSAIFWFRLVPRFFGFLGWAVFGFAGDSVLV